MKDCPVCYERLAQTEYEGEAVLRCTKCRGTFLPRYRLEIIKHRQLRRTDDLKARARNEFSRDTKEKIRCPRCRGKMVKKPFDGRFIALTMDCCKTCDWVWLDGGELQLVQLLYETSARAAAHRNMKRRVTELEASPQRKEEFERNMAALPENLPGMEEDAREAVAAEALDLALRILFRR